MGQIEESQAVANKPAPHEIMPKLFQFDVRTTLLLTLMVYINRLVVVASEMCEIPINCLNSNL